MTNEQRRLELTSKLMKMGDALNKEGHENGDVTVSQIGTMLIFMGGLLLDEDDVNKFSELVSMFSAKKLIENMQESNNDFNSFMDYQSNRLSYDDIIDRIDGLKDNLDDDDYDEDEEDFK